MRYMVMHYSNEANEAGAPPSPEVIAPAMSVNTLSANAFTRSLSIDCSSSRIDRYD